MIIKNVSLIYFYFLLDVTLLLPSWIVDQNANNTLMNTTGRGQATPQLPPVSQGRSDTVVNLHR